MLDEGYLDGLDGKPLDEVRAMHATKLVHDRGAGRRRRDTLHVDIGVSFRAFLVGANPRTARIDGVGHLRLGSAPSHKNHCEQGRQ